MIGGVPALGCSRERLAGYREALDAAGLAFDPELYRVGDFEYASGYRETCGLLELAAPPTAIFVANDVMAVAALKALHERGVAVPAEMSVVGFDDVEIAAWINPALTTVRQPLAKMGTFAATMLLQLIDGNELASNRVELATELIVRQSCAAPRDGR
jgi:LacI family transcriptional regulator